MNADYAELTHGKETQMNADYADFKHKDITGNIIKVALNVHNTLGFGFAEKVYENALLIELRSLGLAAEQQAQFKCSTPITWSGITLRTSSRKAK